MVEASQREQGGERGLQTAGEERTLAGAGIRPSGTKCCDLGVRFAKEVSAGMLSVR